MTKLISLIVILSIGHWSYGQNKVQRIDSLCTSMYKTGNFNGNILVSEKGKIIYNKSFGYANETTKEALNENSIFELASISKQFTAMAIVMLKEKGKLQYDDHISKYIPELSYYNSITIRHLLTHTSGLPRYEELMDVHFDKTKIATNKDIIALYANLKPKLEFVPNTKWQYSNTGYALLASIIENVSKQSYGDYLQDNIFKPLEMNNTFVYTRRYAPKTVNNYAYGYVYSDELNKYVLPDDFEDNKFVIWLDGIVGDGTVNSTVIDLLKWDRALYDNKLVSVEGMKEIMTDAALDDKTKTAYGFGWQIKEDKIYGKIYHHGGAWPGYRNMIERHITTDKTIITLQNYYSEKIENPLAKICKILYDVPFPQYIELSDVQKEMFIGKYKNQEARVRTITLENGKLYRMNDEFRRKMELRPISATKFHQINSDPDIFFEFVLKDNKIEKYILTQPATNTIGEALWYKDLAFSYGLLLEKNTGQDAFAKLIEMVADSTYLLDENELNELAYDFFYRNGKPAYAFETLRAAIYLFPMSDNLYNSYGEMLAKSGKIEDAIIMYRKSLELNPKNEDSIKSLKKLEQ